MLGRQSLCFPILLWDETCQKPSNYEAKRLLQDETTRATEQHTVTFTIINVDFRLILSLILLAMERWFLAPPYRDVFPDPKGGAHCELRVTRCKLGAGGKGRILPIYIRSDITI